MLINFCDSAFALGEAMAPSREHLQPMRAAGKGNKVSAARALKETGASNVVIARELGVSEGTVRHWLKKAGEDLQTYKLSKTTYIILFCVKKLSITRNPSDY